MTMYMYILMEYTDGVPYDGAVVTTIHPNSVVMVVIFSVATGIGLVYSAGCLIYIIIFRNRK